VSIDSYKKREELGAPLFFCSLEISLTKKDSLKKLIGFAFKYLWFWFREAPSGMLMCACLLGISFYTLFLPDPVVCSMSEKLSFLGDGLSQLRHQSVTF